MIDPETGEIFVPQNNKLDIDPELVESINLDNIDKDALDVATTMCKDLAGVYFDEYFMKSHPELKKRLDHELESMRILIKMRKSDEQIHDLNMHAITNHPENASLYRALSQTQKSLLDIQRQIDETVKNINSVLKTVQADISLEPEVTEQDTLPLSSTHRGSKRFIEEMKQKQEN